MLKKTILSCALALGLAAPAFAGERPVRTQLDDTVVTGVDSPHRNTGGVIIGDVIGGAVAGAAVGGGVVLYDHYVSNNGNGGWGNWGRTIAIGAGIGAAAGLVLGLIDAGTSSDRAPNGALVDYRPTGMGPAFHAYGARF